MAIPKKLPSGQWRARGYYKDPITGKEYRPSFTAASKAEASRMVLEWEAEKERAAAPREMTIAECIDRYIAAKRDAISPATLNGYLWMQSHRYAEISHISLGKLTDEDLQRYVSDLTRAGLSAKTVRNTYGLLISAVGMFSNKTYRVTMPAAKPIERHIPSDADIKDLLDAATPSMRIAIALASSGTLRLGEVCALKYGDILRDQNAIRVHADMVKSPDGYVLKENPKTASSVRIIPLNPKIIALFGDGNPEERIYKANPGTLEKNFCKLRNKLGLKCRFHDLRHYAASIMHALGVPDQYIMERGGWKSDAVLKSVYRNTLSDQSAKFAAIESAHYDKFL